MISKDWGELFVDRVELLILSGARSRHKEINQGMFGPKYCRTWPNKQIGSEAWANANRVVAVLRANRRLCSPYKYSSGGCRGLVAALTMERRESKQYYSRVHGFAEHNPNDQRTEEGGLVCSQLRPPCR